MHGVVVPNPLRQGKLHFAQWTARIRSRQVVAVHLGDRLVSGEYECIKIRTWTRKLVDCKIQCPHVQWLGGGDGAPGGQAGVR